MRAVIYNEYGPSAVLHVGEIPIPRPAVGQVLLRVTAAGVNPADTALRAGDLKDVLPLDLPHTPAVEVAGMIAAVGPDVSGWQEHTRVAAYLPLGAQGAAAEYVLAPAEALASVPEGVDLVEAAALPVVGLTAHQALYEHGGLRAGQNVLVNGAGGAVGGFAVQLAHIGGARVTATASGRSAARVRADGADSTVDYSVTPVTEMHDRFDLVLNFVRTSPDDTAALISLVRDGGVIVSATSPVPDKPERGVTAVQMTVHSDADLLTELLQQVATRALTIHVDERHGLDEFESVQARIDRGERTGKVVLIP